jgi:hypothetical protein
MHIIVFAVIVIVVLMYGTLLALKGAARREQAELDALEERLAGIELLNHAIAYLEEYGLGDNLEIARARWVLEYARESVIWDK